MTGEYFSSWIWGKIQNMVGKRTHNQQMFLLSLVDSISLPMALVGSGLRVMFVPSAASILFAERIVDSPIGEYCNRFMYGHEKFCVLLGKCFSTFSVTLVVHLIKDFLIRIHRRRFLQPAKWLGG